MDTPTPPEDLNSLLARTQDQLAQQQIRLAQALERIAEEQRGRFVCPRCGAASSHPEDLRQGYCGRCHDFTGQQPGRLVPWDESGGER